MAIKPVTAQEAAIKKILENPANEIQGAVSYTNPTDNATYKYTPTVKVGAQDSGIQKILSNPNNEINGGVSYEKGNTRYSYTPSYNAQPKSPSYTQTQEPYRDISQELINAYKFGDYDKISGLEQELFAKVAKQGGYFEGGSVNDFITGLRQQYSKGYNNYQQIQQMKELLGGNVTSPYDSLYQSLLKKYSNYNFDAFKNSTAYQSMRDLYETSGKKVMKNVLGEIAARTGGYASSYATAAAQEQYDDYMQQLAQIAQQMYSGEKNSLLSDLKMVGDRADNYIEQQRANNINVYNALRQLQQDQKAEEDAEAQKEANARQSAADYIKYQVNTAGVPLDQLDPELVAQSGIPYTQLMALAKEYQDKLAQQEWKNSMEEDTHNLNWAKYGLSASKAGRSSGGGGGSRKSTGGGSQSIDQIKDNITRYMETGSTKDELISAVDDLYKSGEITGDQRTSLYDYIKILFSANTFTIPESRKVK